jgi:hypothetical protein
LELSIWAYLITLGVLIIKDHFLILFHLLQYSLESASILDYFIVVYIILLTHALLEHIILILVLVDLLLDEHILGHTEVERISQPIHCLDTLAVTLNLLGVEEEYLIQT